MTVNLVKALAAAALMAPLAFNPAQAARAERNCYEDIGCPWKELAPFDQLRKLSCQALAHVRNHTYYENYYCFHRQSAIASYGNADCKYQLTALMNFNSFERTNLGRIHQVEKEKRCR